MWTKYCVLVFCMTITHAYSHELFVHADMSAGKVLLEKNCISCHASSYGGDGSEIYTRPFRKISTASGLLTQVRQCSTSLNLKWFDEDEQNVAAYLNYTYYLFK